jgi:rhamnulokinase
VTSSHRPSPTGTTGPTATAASSTGSGEAALYATTGVQLQPFNTLFQLAAHDPRRAGAGPPPAAAARAARPPPHRRGRGERTSAGTTALVDLAAGTGRLAGLARIGLDAGLLPPIRPAGHRWRLAGVPVPPGRRARHGVGRGGDGVAAGTRPAFVSAGTWLLVGREQAAPDTGDGARPPTSPTRSARSAGSGS